MRKGLRRPPIFNRKTRPRSLRVRWTSVLLTFAVVAGLIGSVWLVARFRTASAASPEPFVQLVRLSISEETRGGSLRIEIAADGSISDVTTKERGRETILRISPARSLLRASYAVNDSFASLIRTQTGESNGVPFVEIVVTTTVDNLLLEPRKKFNRLVLNIAENSAQSLRPRTGGTKDESNIDHREINSMKAAVPVLHAGEKIAAKINQSETSRGAVEWKIDDTILTTDTLPQASASASLNEALPRATVSRVASVDAVMSAAPARVVAPSASINRSASSAAFVFRGRAIWEPLPEPTPDRLSRYASSSVPRLFLQTPNATVNSGVASQPGANAAQNNLPMTVFAPGASTGFWIPGTTVAESDQVGGRVLGAGVLRPSFLFGAEYNSNFFYRSIAGQNLGLFTFAPRLEYEVPGEMRALRVAYEARLRRLTNGHWANGQTLDFDSRFDLSHVLRLALRNHFVRSALDAREYDPAGETYIEGDTFTRNDSGARAELTLDARNRLALDLGYNFVRWSDRYIRNAPLFINYAEFRPALSIEHDVSERTTALAEFSFTDTTASVPLRAELDGLNDRRQFDLMVGARTQTSETSGFAFRAGFERSVSRNAPAANDFSGFVFDAMYRREISAKTNFQLAALRKTQVSSFNLEGGNARLVSTGGALRVEKNQTDSLQLGLDAHYQRLSFPVAVVENSTASGGLFVGDFAGLRRRDNLYGFGLDAGYQFGDLLRARLAYSFARRNSSIPLLTFNRNLLSLIFEFGRRDEARGRSF